MHVCVPMHVCVCICTLSGTWRRSSSSSSLPPSLPPSLHRSIAPSLHPCSIPPSLLPQVPATEHSELAAAVTVPAVGVVTNLELKPENESSFDATWVVPTTIACTLIEYQVALCDKNGASLGDNHTVPNSNHRFVDVASGSTFTARVMARAQATGGPDGTSTFTLQAAW